jgi:hypothetical protein
MIGRRKCGCIDSKDLSTEKRKVLTGTQLGGGEHVDTSTASRLRLSHSINLERSP